MSKYLLLALLNAPFITYGLFKAVVYTKEGVYSKSQLGVRLIFWLGCLALIILAKPIYEFLRGNNLTDSPPLSIADVLLTTISFLSLTMVVRIYARLEKAERKLTHLNEELALKEAQRS
jgi:hypothetical protein